MSIFSRFKVIVGHPALTKVAILTIVVCALAWLPWLLASMSAPVRAQDVLVIPRSQMAGNESTGKADVGTEDKDQAKNIPHNLETENNAKTKIDKLPEISGKNEVYILPKASVNDRPEETKQTGHIIPEALHDVSAIAQPEKISAAENTSAPVTPHNPPAQSPTISDVPKFLTRVKPPELASYEKTQIELSKSIRPIPLKIARHSVAYSDGQPSGGDSVAPNIRTMSVNAILVLPVQQELINGLEIHHHCRTG